MRLAIAIECGGLGIVPETDGAVLVRYARERDSLTQEDLPREERDQVFLAADGVEDFLELRDETFVALVIVGCVREPDGAVAVHRHAIVRVRQVFRGEPEIERVLRHQLERHPRDERGRAGRQHVTVGLSHEGDVPHRVGPLLRAEVEVVDCERLLEARRVGALGERQVHRVDVRHVMPSHDARAVRQALRMPVVRRAQEQRRRVDRAARDDYDVRRVRLRGAVAPHLDARHRAARRPGIEACHVGVREQRDVGVGERRIHAHHLGVGLGVDQARVAVARVAADAAAGARIALVEHDAEGHVERPQPNAAEVVGELLDARLVAHRREGVRRARRWLGRIAAALTVDLVEPLRLGVVRLELVVRDRPRG